MTKHLVGSFIAILSVGIATSISLLTLKLFGTPQICPYFLAIVVSGWFFGGTSAAVALVASVLAADWYVIEPGSFGMSQKEVPRFVCFIITASTIAFFVAARRKAELTLREIVEALEAEVDDRTEKLDSVITEKKAREESSTRHRMTAAVMQQKIAAIEKEIGDIRMRFDALTARERDVFRMVMSGLLNKQIASKLDLAEITVKIHRRNLMRKMSAKTLVELVRLGERLELRAGL